MKKAGAILLAVLVLALWIFSGTHGQRSISQQESTVQAQLTAVAKPAHNPTR